MNGSRRSPSMASTIWASRVVPRVVVTMAWVSPRVNSAEPWVRGSSFTRLEMSRTTAGPRPSMRLSPARIEPRTMDFSSFSNAPRTADSGRRPSSSPASASIAAPRASLTRIRRSILSTTRYASSMLDCAFARTASDSASSAGGGLHSHLGFPASAASASIASIARCICLWPNITALSITDSGSTFASDSTISTAFLVPATTRSRCDFAACPKVGLSTNSPRR